MRNQGMNFEIYGFWVLGLPGSLQEPFSTALRKATAMAVDGVFSRQGLLRTWVCPEDEGSVAIRLSVKLLLGYSQGSVL